MAAQWRTLKYMARPYTLKKRAQQQSDTRRRIVEAAVDLHREIGPALTSLSSVAARAGVQRNTLYAHFPDERSLFLACSGLALERDPLPDAAPWRRIKDRGERLRTGIAAVHGWYARNAELAGCVLRDAQFHELTRDIATLRFGPSFTAYTTVLGAGLTATQRALLALALDYFAWRSLVRDSGLAADAAVTALVQAIEAARP
jgi:AcrR family transcriptional regulator